ncbi:MAG: dihydroorotate dehydrogenase B catalytic subunit [Bacteroidetes bacterium GWF2_43_63]|nr:MAG: dihydroorotate dehydrogenase B catalytic subunit [Bacteroidetes bacterium GWE2_42_42]OFY55269.1 MAG: dihydroorotate dehydrogenase B catalytic subunit [Bacteroidetes bacterium GWF2_43_63]HBG70847.1 dihydroorotate dehydrogenase [Bacteroidales bacterium]HCB63389.1 dihydroorotate dehydrogenase [Bacteroidales bacterium]HCY23092.1 dihydroorotate dehydrogenase [Bacteroidales bacterium]
MADLKVNIGNFELQNPVLTASGTFGYGYEFEDFLDINKLGGIIVKGTTLEPRQGNAYPRMAETATGMLNAVGLQNKGVHVFIDEILPKIKHYQSRIIVNLAGSKVEDYTEAAAILNEVNDVPAIELNVSCPNVKTGGMAFGTSCASLTEVVKAVRNVYKKHLMVKLSPNVTNIAEFAKTAEDCGADSVSVINTLMGMAIDAETRKPKLSTITGGLSGPAIKPVALRMVWQCSKAVKIPIIGLGGIMNATDAIEFMLAGATAIQVGTANFINPSIAEEIVNGINEYCDRQGVKHVSELIGAMRA